MWGASSPSPRSISLLTRPLPLPRRAPGELLRPPPLLSVAPPPRRRSSPSAARVSFALPWNTPCAPPSARSGLALPPEHGRAAAAPWSPRRSRVADGPALWSGQSASDRLKPEPPVLETGTSGFGLTSAKTGTSGFETGTSGLKFWNLRFCQGCISKMLFHVYLFAHNISCILFYA